MSKTKKWKGGNREVKPLVEDDLLNPENPNYLLTDAEFQQMKNDSQAVVDEKKKVENENEDWEVYRAGKIGRT